MGIRQFELLVKERCQSGTLTMEDALQSFHHLLTAKNPAPSIRPFNHLFAALVRMKNSNNHYATIFSLFNHLIQELKQSLNLEIFSDLRKFCNKK
jgi:hypothetical protein